VIALESLFSAGQGELKLRISASVAWLLEPSVADRRKPVYNEVKKLYDARSAVLHGRPASPQETVPKHLRAANIAVAVLRTLFESRTELIEDTNRAETLLVSDDRLS
jgi:Apea-like HEPN